MYVCMYVCNHSFIHSFNRGLLGTYSVLGTGLSTRHPLMNKTKILAIVELLFHCGDVTEWTRRLWGPSVTVDSSPDARKLELWLSMPEFGEKERNYLFKSYTDLW